MGCLCTIARTGATGPCAKQFAQFPRNDTFILMSVSFAKIHMASKDTCKQKGFIHKITSSYFWCTVAVSRKWLFWKMDFIRGHKDVHGQCLNYKCLVFQGKWKHSLHDCMGWKCCTHVVCHPFLYNILTTQETDTVHHTQSLFFHHCRVKTDNCLPTITACLPYNRLSHIL